MKVITVNTVRENPKDYICIGRQGENNATTVVFDCSAFAELYGEGAAELLYKRPGDATPYPCATKQSENQLSWAVTETDTAKRGVGQLELRWYVEDALAKSMVFHITILGALSVGVDDEPDEAHKAWMDAVLAAGVEAKTNAEESRKNAELTAQSEELVTNAVTAAQEAAEDAKSCADILIPSATQHRNIYRGKNLGTSITDAQKAAIKNGTFDDLYIGDYWVINGTTYIIADMDYWYNTGDTAFTNYHLVMIPRTAMYYAQMNETDTTAGGYVGSLMYTENLENAKSQIFTDFGDMLLTHREYLVNAVSDGHPNAGGWFDSSVELMNEIMVYGSHIHAPMGNGTSVYARYTIDKQQLSLFRLAPTAIMRLTIWLRDIASAARFASVNAIGYAAVGNASSSCGVRPVFPIG